MTDARQRHLIFSQNLCISCGVCNTKQRTSFEFNEDGYLLPKDTLAVDISVCPQSALSRDEDEIGKLKFAGKLKHSAKIGYYDRITASQITDSSRLAKKSSGGAITFILEHLLRTGAVDSVATVFSHADEPFFRYELCSDPEKLQLASTSAYYPVELSEVIAEAHRLGLKIAVTGLPCTIKGLNNLVLDNPAMAETVKYQIALICGHLKTTRYLEVLSRQTDELDGACFNFRGKGDSSQAKWKFFQKQNDTEIVSAKTADLYAGTYNYGFFQYHGCNYCDDVIGETADLSVGDAWLPEYVDLPQGVSLCVSRNPILSNALSTQGVSSKDLRPEDVLAAQSGGYRQRREGLRVRLDEFPVRGVKKREYLLPKKISKRRKSIYLARYHLSAQSIQAYSSSKSISEFRRQMIPYLSGLEGLQRVGLVSRVWLKIMRELRKAFIVGS